MRPSPLGTRSTIPPRNPAPLTSGTERKRHLRWFLLVAAGAFLGGVLLFVVGNWVVIPLVTYRSIVRVPDLYGLDMAIAKRTLLDSGLSFVNDSTDYVWDYDVPANHVATQNPPPFLAVKKGRGVRVTISRGPQLYPAPDLRNMSPTQAKLRLQQQFFEVGRVRYVLRTNEDRSEPFVSEQTPPPGSMLPRGSRMDLKVSILPEMPDLTRRSLEEAKRYVELLGLRVGAIRYEQNEDLLPRSVVSQSIPPGRRIQAGDTVDLTLSHL